MKPMPDYLIDQERGRRRSVLKKLSRGAGSRPASRGHRLFRRLGRPGDN